MKRLLVIALMMVTITVSAQTKQLKDIDTIYNVSGKIYTNLLSDIQDYHESDWLVYDYKESSFGKRTIIYLDETAIPTVYTYHLNYKRCYEMNVTTDKQVVKKARKLLAIIISEEDIEIVQSK